MREQDRKHLEELRISPEAIAKTEEVLKFWGIEVLFVKCTQCGKLCYSPSVPGRYRRKKLPAELFYNRNLIGFTDRHGDVVCLPCEDANFG